MEAEKLARLRARLRQGRVDCVLLGNPFNVAWLSDYYPAIGHGPDPFAAPPVLWVGREDCWIVVAAQEESSVPQDGLLVRPYPGYSVADVPDPVGKQAEVLGQILEEESRPSRVGIEAKSLLAYLQATITVAWPDAEVVPIDGWVDSLRAVKTEEEVDRLRAACALSDLGQFRVRELARAGATEIGIFGEVQATLGRQAGRQVPVTCNVLAGERTATGGGPSARVVHEGDLVLSDVACRLDGFWGDTCTTFAVGESPAALRRVFQTVLDVLEMAKEQAKPGVIASDLDNRMRSAIERQGYRPYFHHSGHGLGVAFHEEPRIVPYSHTVLEPGMVVALEPAVYLPEQGGVRLEDVVLVKLDGAEVLTTHEKRL